MPPGSPTASVWHERFGARSSVQAQDKREQSPLSLIRRANAPSELRAPQGKNRMAGHEDQPQKIIVHFPASGTSISESIRESISRPSVPYF